jgi:cell division protein FtsL
MGLLVAAAAALFLFTMKQDVRQMEDDLHAAHRDILDQQEAIHVLESEWSFLNQPARIEDLAIRHLGLQPIPAERIVRLDDLPLRQPQAAPVSAGSNTVLDAIDNAKLLPAASRTSIAAAPEPATARSAQ